MLQILVLVNPLVYMSEGLRTALTPAIPHMPAWVAVIALLIGLLVLGTFGVQGFIKRVLT
jgi:ABC-2 type transport system permease protein